jgi:hypothetical protein
MIFFRKKARETAMQSQAQQALNRRGKDYIPFGNRFQPVRAAVLARGKGNSASLARARMN